MSDQFVEKLEVVRLLASGVAGSSVIVSDQKRRYIADYGQCRTVAKGCQIFHCDDCHRSVVVYNPCNRRGCPVCAEKNQRAWLESVKRRLIPTGHLHLVFSFPEGITERWRKNPRETIGELFRAVNRVIKKLERQQGLRIGRMLVFQSHGKGLSYKAHVHCLMTDGGMNCDGGWEKMGVLPLAQMERWVGESLPGSEERKGFGIHQSRYERSGVGVAVYLSQKQFGQIIKPANLEKRSESIEVRDRSGETWLEVENFIQRYLDHVPEKGTVMVRHYGLYSNRGVEWRKKAMEVLQVEEAQKEAEYEPCCPHCQTVMRLVGIWKAYEPKSFEAWGFGSHPPEHWQMGKAS